MTRAGDLERLERAAALAPAWRFIRGMQGLCDAEGGAWICTFSNEREAWFSQVVNLLNIRHGPHSDFRPDLMFPGAVGMVETVVATHILSDEVWPVRTDAGWRLHARLRSYRLAADRRSLQDVEVVIGHGPTRTHAAVHAIQRAHLFVPVVEGWSHLGRPE